MAKWCKSEEQLESEQNMQSKIGDGSYLPTTRPRATAVADFRFRAEYKPQLFTSKADVLRGRTPYCTSTHT